MLLVVAFLCATTAPAPAPANTEPAPAPAPAPETNAPPAPAPATTAPATTTTTTKSQRDSMLVLDLAGAENEPAAKGLTDLLATTLLDKADLDVFAASTVRDRLSHATDKVEAGQCDDAACMAEIAGAAGARYVVYARYSVVADKKLLRLEAFDERTSHSVSVVTVRAPSVGALYDEMPKAVAQLLDRSDGAIPERAASSQSPVVDAPGFFDKPGNTPLVVGGTAFVVGVGVTVAYIVMTGIALGDNSRVDTAVKGYRDAPNIDTAAAVRDANAKANGAVVAQGFLGLGMLAAVPMVLGGGAVALVGIVEKARE